MEKYTIHNKDAEAKTLQKLLDLFMKRKFPRSEDSSIHYSLLHLILLISVNPTNQIQDPDIPDFIK